MKSKNYNWKKNKEGSHHHHITKKGIASHPHKDSIINKGPGIKNLRQSYKPPKGSQKINHLPIKSKNSNDPTFPKKKNKTKAYPNNSSQLQKFSMKVFEFRFISLTNKFGPEDISCNGKAIHEKGT